MSQNNMLNSVLEFWDGLKEGFVGFSGNISIIVNSILLGVVYIIGIGITSIIAKISGKHFLNIKFNSSAKSYWESTSAKKGEKNNSNKTKEDCYRQF